MVQHGPTQLLDRGPDRAGLLLQGLPLDGQPVDTPLPGFSVGPLHHWLRKEGFEPRMHGKAFQGIAQGNRQPPPFYQHAAQMRFVDIRNRQHLFDLLGAKCASIWPQAHQ
ncbi:hypothetical protein D3C80_885610 [compost metagenome]